MKMLVPATALRENDIILHNQSSQNRYVREVQVTHFDFIKVSTDGGDPRSQPATEFFDGTDCLLVQRQYLRSDGTPMPESNTYERTVGEEWDEGMRRYCLRLCTDGSSVWAVQEPIGFSAAYHAQKK